MLLLWSTMGLASAGDGQEGQKDLSNQPSQTAPQSGQAQPEKSQSEQTRPSKADNNSTNKDESVPPVSSQVPQDSGAAAAPAVQPAQEKPVQEKTETQLPAAPQPQRPDETQKPAGAAAAEAGKTTGVAASKPAGAAIAPAKQGRSRSFFIKVGAALGAGVALGTAMALSRSSPSKPPGSH
jgi:hypothetical protein